MPQRPNMPECHGFVKNGCCRFLHNCRYHHPYDRLGMPTQDSAGGGGGGGTQRGPSSHENGSGGSGVDAIIGVQDRAPCDMFLNSGHCSFGDKCRFRHISRGQLAVESAKGVNHPDPNQLPRRAGVPACSFYARTGKCAFGMKCRFDHPTHQNPPPGSYSSTINPNPANGQNQMMPQQQQQGQQQQNGRPGMGGPQNRMGVPSPQKPQPKPITEVTARHILVKHKGSRRPASWQDPAGASIKQRTQAQATSILQGLRSGIKSQEDFSKVATARSDCSSAKRGGDLGTFGRGKMQRAFEDAAFGLPVGGLSGVVSTDSGVHLIMRTA
ncbi:unnamed protein product [Ectocarpus sp. 12 AP-2014]